VTMRIRNRQGEPISWEQFRELMNEEVYVVETTDVGSYWVSTTWCGLAIEDDALFETSIFGPSSSEDSRGPLLVSDCTDTERKALKLHSDVVEQTAALLSQGIDFAGMVDYIRGKRDDKPERSEPQ
jgi:hypothetical protein